MWKGYYGKEPFDLRLTALRLMEKLPVIIAVTILGTVILGGGYYVKNVLLRGERTYAATSIYHVEYAVENQNEIANVYVNEMSWNTYLHSQVVLDAVQRNLKETGMDGISDQALADTIQARIESDLRMPSTIITSDSPEKSQKIAQAVEAAMTRELADSLTEIASITVMESGDTAMEVLPDIRVGRAFVLSAILSCFFVVVILLLKETGDDSIWLPGSIWKRYGVKTAGTLESGELAENVRYLFSGEKAPEETIHQRIAVCGVQKELDSEKVLQGLKETCPDYIGEGWFAVPSPLRDPKVARQLREAEGILLAVKAGCHAGRALERVLEYLAQQDCQVTAAILWDADEKLLRRYHFINIGNKDTGNI